MFVALRKARGERAAFLDVEYSFDEIEDPMIMGREGELPADFMDVFEFQFRPGKIEDSLPNGVGWYNHIAESGEVAKNGGKLAGLSDHTFTNSPATTTSRVGELRRFWRSAQIGMS